MASLLTEFAIDFGGISVDVDLRNANINPGSLSGGRSYRGGGGGESGKELQGQPQEKQEKERSATSEDLRPGGISFEALFLTLAFFSKIDMSWWGRGLFFLIARNQCRSHG